MADKTEALVGEFFEYDTEESRIESFYGSVAEFHRVKWENEYGLLLPREQL